MKKVLAVSRTFAKFLSVAGRWVTDDPPATEAKTMTVIETVVRNITGATFAKVDYSIPAKSYIRKKATDGSTAINPLWDRKDDIRIERENVQVNLGVIFKSVMDGRIEKIGEVEEADYNVEALEKQGKTAHSNPHKLLCQNLARTKTYLRYMPMQNKNRTSRFVLDGKDVTATLKPFMAKVKDYSKKQENAGLEGDQQVKWRTLDIANVRKLSVLGSEITQ